MSNGSATGRLGPARTTAALALALHTGLAAITLAVAFLFRHPVARQLAWLTAAGVPVWIHIFLVYLLGLPPSGEPPDSGAARRLPRFKDYRRFVLPPLELTTVIVLLQTVRIGFAPHSPPAPASASALAVILTAASLAVEILATVYFAHLSSYDRYREFKAGAGFLLFDTPARGLFLIGAIAVLFDAGALPLTVAAWFATILCLAAGAETAFHLLTRGFRHTPPDRDYRSAFQTYLADLAFDPLRAGTVIASFLHDMLGFDVSRNSLFRLAGRLFLPCAGASLIFLELTTCIFFVKPHQQAIVLNLGVLSPRILREGVHGKLPWPLGRAVVYDVDRIRKMHIGSHKPAEGNQSVFIDGVPLLWTNVHGRSSEELLILSSPGELAGRPRPGTDTPRGTGERAPSVSLAGADIVVHYVIADLLSYCRVAESPPEILRCRAEELISRLLYRYDIDSLFCNARLAPAERLRDSLRVISREGGLGIDVVGAGITAVHPPLPTARAFEETVIADQQKATTIEEAGRESVRTKIETTGSTALFDSLAAAIETRESRQAGSAQPVLDSLLPHCGGEVSEMLADALAYRWQREHTEAARADRFGAQYRGFRSAPRAYRNRRLCEVVEDSLADRKKVVVTIDPARLVLRKGTEEAGMVPMQNGSLP